jgi:hypothetical protein
MIVTEGGKFGGYGFYLLKGKPVFTYNFFNIMRFRWEGAAELAPGKHALVFDFTYDGPGLGKGGITSPYDSNPSILKERTVTGGTKGDALAGELGQHGAGEVGHRHFDRVVRFGLEIIVGDDGVRLVGREQMAVPEELVVADAAEAVVTILVELAVAATASSPSDVSAFGDDDDRMTPSLQPLPFLSFKTPEVGR